MKALILAALLAVTPISASNAQPLTIQEEVELTSAICLKGALGEIKAEEVIQKLKLDTPEKRREFGLHCALYLQGFKDAVQASHDRDKGPDA